MAKLGIQVASTSQTVNVFIQNSSVTTGAGLTGLVYNTSSLTAYYALPKAAPVAITLATLAAATTAYSSGGFFELDATNMPGLYRLDIPNAALASGRFVDIILKGATNMAPCVLEIELTAINNQSTGFGLASLPSNHQKGATATFEFTMTNSTTGAVQTGLTVAGVISKDGGAFASTSNAVTEIANGWYQIVLTASEMTANNVSLQFTATGATSRNMAIQSQP